VVGRRGDQWWLTTTGTGSLPPGLAAAGVARSRRPEPAAPGTVTFADGALSAVGWQAAVADAVRRITAGALDKVVLARDLQARTEHPVDPRRLLGRLADRYPGCWTFSVDGLVGATPEMLVRREKGLVTSRVLAGTIRRSGNDAHDLELAARLARSSKDPRGARVRRPVGGGGARAALHVDERAGVAVRAAPGERHAPGDRRDGGAGRRHLLARAGGGAAPRRPPCAGRRPRRPRR
jgi:hypothetical protein